MRQLKLSWVIVTVAAAFWACTGFAIHAFGQATNTGTVVGEVSDPSGALVPGATVMLTDVSAGVKLPDVTNACREVRLHHGAAGNLHHHRNQGGILDREIRGRRW